MKKIYFVTVVSILFISLFASTGWSAPKPAPRPPQYVMLAFDGSLGLAFWQESLDFAKKTGTKFTYFASGVYFTLDKNKHLYQFPHKSAGYSCIGWGGTDPQALKSRVGFVNRAYSEGHEIGSHANAHCEGTKAWTTSDWETEFKQFNDIFFNVLGFNNIGPVGNPFQFPPTEVVGFRAPLLEYNANMYPALQNFGFRYDTSRTSAPNYWPKKVAGDQWNFPLAQVTIAGTAKKTLTMDFNFYFADSGGKPDPANAALYEKQMYDTYMNYFQGNYTGNRAPLHIGHHFSKWNGGAYWNALQHFTKTVCVMPEVKCVTYAELADFMDQSAKTGTLSKYEAGQFPRYIPPARVAAIFSQLQRPYDLNLRLVRGHQGLRAVLNGKDAGQILAQGNMQWVINGEPLATSASNLTLNPTLPANSQSTVAMKISKQGIEILSATHTVETDSTGNIISVSKAQLEDRNLMGDMAEAHADEGF